jgi:ParB-like chromosome segregation protein Spo0J
MSECTAGAIERRAIDALIPHSRNARTHSAEQVAQIAAAIAEWGWTFPVLIDEGNGIVAGHGRVLAARKLGIAEVPVIAARGWTEAQCRAYALADNQLALNAGWDESLLRVEIGDLGGFGFDLSLIGFSGEELAGLVSEVPADCFSRVDHTPPPVHNQK